VTGVGTENTPAWAHGEDRRRRPRWLGVPTRGAHGWQCVTWGGATGPREATHARGGSEVRRGDGFPGGGHGGAVERRERGRAAREGGASA
jgi:hypothetical protein